MKNKTILIFTISFLSCMTGFGQHTDLNNSDIQDINKAISLNENLGEAVFPGLTKVPFVLLLVKDSIEFLFNHPYPSDEFHSLKSPEFNDEFEVWYRPRIYPDHYLATFPAVNGVPTIVVGTPEKTGLNTSEWIITLLHEHFHQLQMSQNDYFESVNQMNLSNGDDTGMWMLNYDFPYEEEKVIKMFSILAKAISEEINNKASEAVRDSIEYWFEEIENNLSSNDHAYMSFQLWQEGIARYIEYSFLMKMVEGEELDLSLKPEDTSFFDLLTDFHQREIRHLTTLQLAQDKRLAFYSIGWGLGVVLDKINPLWKENYFKEKFSIQSLFKTKSH